jgi:lipoprotein-anchoring transpeptidase ErfK/SrfK
MYTSIIGIERSKNIMPALANEATYTAPEIPEKIINNTEIENVTQKNNIIFENPVVKQDFIIADLSNMKLVLLKEGLEHKTFDIVSKGKPGSYYETPAGNYNIQSKQDVRLSGIGNVYMPYAMQFFGNFFIHGIPYHENGERVTTSYSGGCIRMRDVDAKEIYDFAKIGTNIIIKNDTNILENIDMGQEVSKNMLIVLTSLEVVNQEKLINFNNQKIKVKDLNYYILNNNTQAIKLVESQLGKSLFDNYKNKKSAAIGITNTDMTNDGDRVLLYNFVKTNKSYILGLI